MLLLHSAWSPTITDVPRLYHEVNHVNGTVNGQWDRANRVVDCSRVDLASEMASLDYQG